MICHACARPIAMARANCVYCGAALSAEGLEEAAQAAQRIRQAKSLASLEAVTRGSERDQQPRRYVVIDTTAAAVEAIAEACGVSPWEARQWQAASRYRLVKVSTEPADGAHTRCPPLSARVLPMIPGSTTTRSVITDLLRVAALSTWG